MRLKRLELQGYKTFASKTEFVFDEGITAIVGPNGSGKSNIADAIRWVLGEQSFGTLRGKRTEDMIFHGSDQRPKLGMASATILLDNSDGALPLEFAEVSIGRRATRDGDNEYYVNGSKVRLRDVSDLLAASGLSKRSYAVIGQGLIDTVLSLRPDERRTLFEEAAGITGHQSKRASALAKLDDTQQNLVRVTDIIAEIEPRLRTLKRQAEQARFHQGLADTLQDKLRVFYGYQWRRAQRSFQEARDRHEEARARFLQGQEQLEQIGREAAAARTSYAEHRHVLAAQQEEIRLARAARDTVARQLAVAVERARLVEQQRLELAEEITPLQAGRAEQEARAIASESELQQLDTRRREATQRMAALEAELQAARRQRQSVLQRVTLLQDESLDVSRQLSDRKNRIEQIGERKQQLARERAERTATRERQLPELDQLRSRMEAAETAEKAARAEQESVDVKAKAEQQALGELAQSLREAQTELGRLEAQVASLESRKEMLARMREEAAGYYPGVKAVVASSKDGKLDGIVGVLAQLITVPARLEKAMEAALGSHLQDVVTETWDAAERAIQQLRADGAGRATFLPLATLRPPTPLQPASLPGLVGMGHSLVTAPPNLRPVLDLLLGNTIVMEDLRSARGAFRSMRGSFRIVTLDGDVVRSSGEMSGGSQKVSGGGLIARQREWDALPADLKALATKKAALSANLVKFETETRRRSDALRELSEASARARKTAEEFAADRHQLSLQADRLRQQVRWSEDLIAQHEKESQTLDERARAATADIARLQDRETTVARELSELRAGLDTSSQGVEAEAAQARTVAALAQQRAEDQKVVARAHRNSLAALDSQLAAKQERLARMDADIAGARVRLTELEAQDAAATKTCDQLAALSAPLEKALTEAEARQAHGDTDADAMRTRIRQLESTQNQALLEMERRKGELQSIQKEMDAELGPIEIGDPNGAIVQQPLPIRPLVGTLPVVDHLPEGLVEEIQQMRGQLKRLALVNPNAPLEYEEAQQRHQFLSSQSEDLNQAAKSLRAVIAELDERMRRDFLRTFRAAAAEFKVYFGRLFGGGSARLELIDPDNVSTSGIEIIARPPGKRTQAISMLSGGERALTAGALIFSILKVSPTPFCVLDEVDAMLDESNVRRFRESLSELAQMTQFVVITHNRSTVEAARTIYGVSMGQDSASRVVSLRLDQVEAKA